MKRFVIVLVLIFGIASSTVIFAQNAAAADTASAASSSWKYIAAALAVGMACIGSGIAVGQIGAAAMGAMSENPEVSGKAMPFIGLAEGICLWGFLVALLILVMK